MQMFERYYNSFHTLRRMSVVANANTFWVMSSKNIRNIQLLCESIKEEHVAYFYACLISVICMYSPDRMWNNME